MPFSRKERLELAISYHDCDEDKHAAAALAVQRCPSLSTRHRLAEAAEFWGKHLLKHFNVDDAPRSGAPRKFSEDDERCLAALLRRGRRLGHGKWHPFLNVEHACSISPQIKQLMEAQDVESFKTVWAAALRADPSLRQRSQDVHAPLPPWVCNERWEAAGALLSQVLADPMSLLRMVFIDAANPCFYVPHRVTAIVSTSDDSWRQPIIDPRWQHHGSSVPPWKLSYMAAVWAMIGAFEPRKNPGSHDSLLNQLRMRKHYVVRHALQPLQGALQCREGCGRRCQGSSRSSGAGGRPVSRE